ncbi:ryncolin-1-like isoform 2-T2 [Cochliomyia hominivorax]
MLYSKRSTILVFILFALSTIEAEAEECNRITIEGGERAVIKIFHDFEDLKQKINELQTNLGYLQPTYNNSKQKVMPFFDERIDKISEKCFKTLWPKDCASATECTKRSGIYKIKIEQYSNNPFYVACDAVTENGDWLVIQKRQDGSVDFYRNWAEYEEGFGDLEELLIVMESANATEAYAKYDAFAIGNETESYKLKRLGKYSGTAGDSFKRHVGMKFSTKDRDNDTYAKGNCAVDYTGAWWYAYCHDSNLNGKYGDNNHGKGINWKAFRGHKESLVYVKMMVRRSTSI